MIKEYYEIHAINSDKAIGLYAFPGLETNFKVLCGSEVTRKKLNSWK